MIIDTSAVLAILFDEDDAAGFAGAIAGADRPLLYKGNDFSQTDIASALE